MRNADKGAGTEYSDGKCLLAWFGYVIVVDVECELQLPHLVRTDAHTVLYGAVVFQCCVKESGGEGRGGGGRGGGGRNIRNNERSIKWSTNTVTNQFIY